MPAGPDRGAARAPSADRRSDFGIHGQLPTAPSRLRAWARSRRRARRRAPRARPTR